MLEPQQPTGNNLTESVYYISGAWYELDNYGANFYVNIVIVDPL